MPAKSNDLYRVFPYIDLYHRDKEYFGYVFIRIASRQDRNKNFNIPVYLSDRSRLKLRKEHLENFQVVNMAESKLKTYNALIDKLVNHFVDFTSKDTFTKKTLEQSVYNQEFLEGAKGKQIRFHEVEIKEQVTTEYYLELRKLYPKKEDIERITRVDKDGLEVVEEKHIVFDPLSLDDFPKRLHPDVYEKFRNDFLSNYSEDQRAKFLNGDVWFLNQRILFHLHVTKKLFQIRTKEVLSVDKTVIKKFNQNHANKQDKIETAFAEKVKAFALIETAKTGKQVTEEEMRKKLESLPNKSNPIGRSMKRTESADGKSISFTYNTNEVILDLHQKNFPTEERYRKGHYDQTNIFELFGSIRYNKLYAEEYNKIVIRLFQYRHFAKPKENVGDLSKEWLADFFKYLWTTGYYSVNTKIFDPLNFDGSIFKGKKIIKYESDQIHSLRNIMRTVINKFLADGSLNPEMKLKIEFPKISKITGKAKGSSKKIERM